MNPMIEQEHEGRDGKRQLTNMPFPAWGTSHAETNQAGIGIEFTCRLRGSRNCCRSDLPSVECIR